MHIVQHITLLKYKLFVHRAQRLEDFGDDMKKWLEVLNPVLEQLIESKKGNIDAEFWSEICRVNVLSFYLGEEDRILSGWLGVFNVFNAKGHWVGYREDGKKWPEISLNEAAPGIVNVPIKMQHPLGSVIEARMFAGHMAHSIVGEDQTSIQPYVGWAVAV
jgi:hypothetical protein